MQLVRRRAGGKVFICLRNGASLLEKKICSRWLARLLAHSLTHSLATPATVPVSARLPGMRESQH